MLALYKDGGSHVEDLEDDERSGGGQSPEGYANTEPQHPGTSVKDQWEKGDRRQETSSPDPRPVVRRIASNGCEEAGGKKKKKK